MKKILLIPTLLTVASTPLISMVGCGKNQFKLTHRYVVTVSGHDLPCLRTEKKLNLDTDITYTALISASDFFKTNLSKTPAYDLKFYVTYDEMVRSNSETARIATASVSVDGSSLTMVNEEPKANEFAIRAGSHNDLIIGPNTISSTSKIKISFSLSLSVQYVYIISKLLAEF